MSNEVLFRKMTYEDIPAVAGIELESFATPWTEEIFEHELTGNEYAHYIVADLDGEVIGHCGMWIVLDECHITNVAVLSAYRGKGYGEDLMRQAMELCRLNEVKSMTLEVRVSNEPARMLYRKLGFQEGGIRKNYYTDDHEDGLVMWVEF
ncbi:ribosomal-protein-alanine N-acetyltransferase [Sporosarcina sp. P21c]|uniref:ribosomal protein S18-alanine N-acetyltransferase n=1 Tax=Sporosarcina TaxID=1569 RepID=UPI000A16A74C|nr:MULTISPECIES: ribosomal protein S18-alanine N-acetyltransferase [Sporosarcina]ARJ38669.1 ribosomal-protein-alanine N-acetyltransferase RimI [Sporosarcina ureae]PIC67485.1 ribosomal-protein-alanine N-acetyltransferase [Sporosarcina sp. P16a]PIC81779.1 ribosomal-protein-alanine N-acetyltransferase [Sporosarcina sp. P1]PIC89740.1 ribosomal-protein-alanine N-acetyltransferase [Sporosarcina sp. P21c]PIC92936.1 ribosomal-protein-alanine N-acetyltransferase [Sporosarcina sp. P25]